MQLKNEMCQGRAAWVSKRTFLAKRKAQRKKVKHQGSLDGLLSPEATCFWQAACPIEVSSPSPDLRRPHPCRTHLYTRWPTSRSPMNYHEGCATCHPNATEHRSPLRPRRWPWPWHRVPCPARFCHQSRRSP